MSAPASSRRPRSAVVLAAAYAALVMAHADALRAAGVNGKAPANAGAIKSFVSAITDNALWLIGTVATLAILVIGGLFFFGHSPRGRLRGQDRRRRGDHRVRARHRRLDATVVRRAIAATSRSVARSRRARELAPVASRSRPALLAVRAAWPAPAHAADLFPVDDWLGDGIKKAGDVVLGPLKLGAKEIAQLLATIVGALADLLVPKSLVSAGLDGIKWLVQLPPVGADATPAAGRAGGADAAPGASCATR